METLADVAQGLRDLRAGLGITQAQLAKLASVPRVTLARMETASQGDMSVATLLRLLEATGHEMRFARRAGHSRTLEDILEEQRQTGGAPR